MLSAAQIQTNYAQNNETQGYDLDPIERLLTKEDADDRYGCPTDPRPDGVCNADINFPQR